MSMGSWYFAQTISLCAVHKTFPFSFERFVGEEKAKEKQSASKGKQ